MKYNVDNLTKKITKSKNRKKVLSSVIYLVLILFLIINIILVLQSTFNSQKVPNLFGYKTFSIITGSMEPTLKVNDLIITKNCKEKDINKGDIITYKRGSSIITHRVDNIQNENGTIYYLTKGDGNYIYDEYKVKYKDIEGKYVKRIPKIGKVVSVLKNRKIIIIVILIFLGLNYFSNKKNKEKIVRQEQRRMYEKKKKQEESNNSAATRYRGKHY